jgi:hypothetical protein
MEACEAREHGSDSKQNRQVEGSIMQAKEWTITFGRCNQWSTRSQSKKESMSALEKNRARKSSEAPRPANLPPFKAPWCSPSAGKSLIQFLIRVLEFIT